MRRNFLCLAVVGLLMIPFGCGEKPLTPEQITKICNESGQISALAWVAAAKPTPDQVKAVKFVLDDIAKNLKEYQQGGFIAALPGIEEGIKKAFPGEDERNIALRKIASTLAKNMLEGLDNLFAQHPDWKNKGAEVAGYVAAYASGGSAALDDFVVKETAKLAKEKK